MSTTPWIPCQGEAPSSRALLGSFMKWTLNALNFKEEIIVQLPCLLMASGAEGHISAGLEQHDQEGFVYLAATWEPCGLRGQEPTAASVQGKPGAYPRCSLHSL